LLHMLYNVYTYIIYIFWVKMWRIKHLIWHWSAFRHKPHSTLRLYFFFLLVSHCLLPLLLTHPVLLIALCQKRHSLTSNKNMCARYNFKWSIGPQKSFIGIFSAVALYSMLKFHKEYFLCPCLVIFSQTLLHFFSLLKVKR
jgi:hypothetical protein